MIIEQLALSNWLSYPTKWVINGNPQKPCLQFQNHPSYVIFGKNGAGKSSVMEAILFALFGDYSRTLDYRGKKRRGIHNNHAIRTGETSATVELIFSLNGQRHKIKRILQQKSGQAYYHIWDTDKEEWRLEKSKITEVNDTIASLIGMKRDLFCGTVVLEQGKAGRFMELKAKDQVDYVINLLSLDIYARYYEQAKKLGNERKRQAKDIEENDLHPLADISLEKVKAAEESMNSRQTVLDKATREVENLTALLTHVEVIDRLRQQIASINSQIEAYEPQLAQKDEIEAAAQLIGEWEQIQPKLDKARQTTKRCMEQHSRVSRLESDLTEAEERVKTAKTALATLKPTYEQAKNQRETLENNLPQLKETYDEAKQQRDLIIAERKLDSREAELRTLQNERKTKLADWETVERNYYLRDELRQAGIELKEIVNLVQNSASTLQELDKTSQVLREQETLWQNRQDAWRQEQERIKTFEAKVNSQKEYALRLKETLQTNKALLKRREKAHGQSACPTCGTRMSGQVLDRFHQELANLRQRVDDGSENWTKADKDAKGLEAQLTAHKRESDAQRNSLTREKSELDSEQRHLEEKREEVNDNKQSVERRWQSLQETLDYTADIIVAPTKTCLDHAREILKTVNNANQLYSDLQKVQIKFDNTQDELSRIDAQRQRPFNTFNQVQENEAREIVTKLKTEIDDVNKQLTSYRMREHNLWQEFTRIKGVISTSEQAVQTIQRERLPQERQLLDIAMTEQEQACMAFEASLGVLSWPQEKTDALRDMIDDIQGSAQVINSWIDSHRLLASKQSELQQALHEIGGLETQKATLRSQIGNYPVEAQEESVEQVKRLLEENKKLQKQYDGNLQNARHNFWEVKDKLERKQAKVVQYKQVMNEAGGFQALADLLAPPSGTSAGGDLLHKIMQGALQDVAIIASEILEDWGQTTEVIVPEEALRFKMLDRASSNSERDYQLFSGGEKFMVALAMALAIGKVAGGTGQMDCLFIDEGFGLLDADNRAVVAHEIVGNLVSSGHRRQVIVITHMDDIKSAFPHKARLHLINAGNETQLRLEGDDEDA